MSRHLAIIAARAGSKSIIDKNLIRLPNQQGKNITRIAIESAIEANIFGHILITSDIPKTDINMDNLGGNAMTRIEYLKRPPQLCTDEALMIDVVKHAINYVSGDFKWVWLLQPTSPFRNKHEYKVIKTVLDSDKYGSVISFKPVKEHPNRIYTCKEDEDGLIKAHLLREC